MERVKRRRRRLVVLIVLAVIMLWAGGCAAGQALSLTSFKSNGGKQTTVGGGDVAVIGSSGPKDEQQNGGIITGKLPADDDKDGKATHKPSDDGAVKGNDKDSENATGKGENKETDTPATHVPAKPDPTPPAQPTETNKPTPGSESDKLVALTFDDGPDNHYTTAILDILKEKGVKATFFVVGIQIDKYPDVVKRIVEEGHAIGNHTQGHKDLSKLSKSQISDQIDKVDQSLKELLGYVPPMVRAPYGAVSDTLKKLIKDNDRKLVGWTVDTRDWAGTSIDDMRAVIREKTKPNGIILMHSFGSKHIQNTVDMLPDVIDDLEELGYTFVTVDQLP